MTSIIWRLAAALAALMVAGEANAGERMYVSASTLNCRSAPSASAEVIAKLNRAAAVTVRQRQASWAEIDHKGTICWASSRYLTSDYTSAAARQSSATSVARSSKSPATSTYSSGRRSSRSGSSNRSSGGYYDQGCPCSGSRVCIGPRGGRYCITSGGNKRYGV